MLNFLRTLQIRCRLGHSGKYISANGTEFYVETYGSGEPLFLFHGGLSTVETFRLQVPEFSRHYRVILPERRGHGHTRDAEGPFSYEAMADDMAALMHAMGIERAKMAGYSDGANLILFLARKYPEFVERFVLIAGNFHHSGCIPEHQEELRKIPEGMLGEEGIDSRYARVSPDGPGHYVKVLHKAIRLWLEEPALTAEDLRQIQAPGLVMAGDHDVISLEHTKELYDALPKREFALMPGATHRLIKENPELVNAVILRFLKPE